MLQRHLDGVIERNLHRALVLRQHLRLRGALHRFAWPCGCVLRPVWTAPARARGAHTTQRENHKRQTFYTHGLSAFSSEREKVDRVPRSGTETKREDLQRREERGRERAGPWDPAQIHSLTVRAGPDRDAAPADDALASGRSIGW